MVEVREGGVHDLFGFFAKCGCPGGASGGEDMLGPEMGEAAFVQCDVVVNGIALFG